ncbi:opioid growth factor receptor isoform X2 [Sceloporus undulatus]|uniref:opioid growth factor receptor isoform X2 n=1 Tax=Sceloporus undulatus TaxID=8520 RepID=UPI001C4BB1F4|nr:opioid growth factor receptor isoform X2 [Sceloporus undulatus]
MAARKAVGGEAEAEGEGEQSSEDSEEEYDSTWEEEEQEEEEQEEGQGKTPEAKNPDKHGWWSPTRASGSQSTNRRNWMAARDMQKYRHHYPGLKEAEVGEQDMWNLNFYKNEIHFLPHGLYIEDLLEKWQNDYGILEQNHSYIQWLFPLREQGMNWRAKLLTQQEIEAFKNSKEVMERFVRAYKLMLGFYGINLINEETGELGRAENWCERFENLNRYSHNNLRITRILKCLGEMGYEHYQVHLVKFFLTETLVNQKLPSVLKSALDYFMFTVRNKQKRRELVHFAWQHYKPRREFVWGPHKKLRRFKAKALESVANSKDEKDSDQEDTRVSHIHSERKDLLEECGVDSENLKESKKRKLEMSRLSGKCNGSVNSPADIEKISCNLRECVIGHRSLDTFPAPEERSIVLVPEESNGDSRNIKESELVSAVVKRRKVEEMSPRDDATGMSEKVTPSEGQATNCSTLIVEKTDQVCQDEAKTDVDPSATSLANCRCTGVDLLVDSQISSEPGSPLDGHAQDKKHE